MPLSKLAAPTTRPARPSSVASSVRSGRMTPSVSGRETPYSISGRRTPALIEEEANDSPLTGYTHAGRPNEVLGRSTKANVVGQQLQAAAASKSAADKITAGSRASHLMGMTAKQLQSRQAAEAALVHTKDFADGGAIASAPAMSNLSRSTLATTTPRPSRISLGGAGAAARTPSRLTSTAGLTAKYGRESLGGFATPKAPSLATRSGRTSAAGTRSAQEMMPPPPSPSKRIPSGGNGNSDELVQSERRCAELLIRVKELEEQQSLAESAKETANTSDINKAQVDKERKEAEQRIRELTLASEFASKDASGWRVKVEQLTEALEAKKGLEISSASAIEALEKEKAALEHALSKAKQDLTIQKERADTEYEKGMELKRKEVKAGEDRILKQEQQIEHERTRYKDLEQTTSVGKGPMINITANSCRSSSRKWSSCSRSRSRTSSAKYIPRQSRSASSRTSWPNSSEPSKPLPNSRSKAKPTGLTAKTPRLRSSTCKAASILSRTNCTTWRLMASGPMRLPRSSVKRPKRAINGCERRLRWAARRSPKSGSNMQRPSNVPQSWRVRSRRILVLLRARAQRWKHCEPTWRWVNLFFAGAVLWLIISVQDLENMRAAQEQHSKTARDLAEQVQRVHQLEADLGRLKDEAAQHEKTAVAAGVAFIQHQFDALQAELLEVSLSRSGYAPGLMKLVDRSRINAQSCQRRSLLRLWRAEVASSLTPTLLPLATSISSASSRARMLLRNPSWRRWKPRTKTYLKSSRRFAK